jgi:hypothetical protein
LSCTIAIAVAPGEAVTAAGAKARAARAVDGRFEVGVISD